MKIGKEGNRSSDANGRGWYKDKNSSSCKNNGIDGFGEVSKSKYLIEKPKSKFCKSATLHSLVESRLPHRPMKFPAPPAHTPH